MNRPAVFLDRDGTIIEDRGHLARPDQAVFIPGAPDALRRLGEKFLLFIVTNQPGIAEGVIDTGEADAVNRHVEARLKVHGVSIAGVYVCPHRRSDGCGCIKPNPFFLRQAADRFGLDLGRSFVVGDHPHDVELARQAGATGIYILTGHGEKHRAEVAPGTTILRDIGEAAGHILSAGGPECCRQDAPPREQPPAEPHDPAVADLFENNRRWAADVERREPGFFESLARQQAPRYLWIGCSDSRVPANEIVGLRPGELFVHRNIANLVVHTDLNCQSVIQYAVEALGVSHIIVCGHYGCGGVAASMGASGGSLVDNWLRHLRDVYDRHAGELNAISDDAARRKRMCELNVIEQARNVCNTDTAQNAWREGQFLHVHAWAYDIHDGLLHALQPPAGGPGR